MSPSHVRVTAPQSQASQRRVGSLGEEPSPTTLRQRPPVCRAVRRHRPEGTADEFGRGGLQKPLRPCHGREEAGKTPCDLFAFPCEGQAKEAARVDSGREDNKSARTIPARV